jgi:hypothetical protein
MDRAMRRSLSQREKKRLEDDARLLRAWRNFHQEELTVAIDGAHGSVIARLMEILRTLELASGPVLLEFIKARNWHTVDAHTKLVVLHEINRAITRLRTRNNLEPFNDPLWGERDNVYRVIKAILFPLHAAPTGAHPGHMMTEPTS